MKLEQIQLPVTNPVYGDYVAKKEKITQFFDYEVSQASFANRAQYLCTQNYSFEKLADVIKQYMEPFGLSQAVQQNIEKLRAGALAIVGGQQAGILTGPLYSVHKAISVLVLAKEQSEALKEPVVPIFWIAGEDHDLDEINHTYAVSERQLKKRTYVRHVKDKKMASATVFDKEEMTKTVEQVFADYGETEFSKQLLADLKMHIEETSTFTQFFTACMNQLFKNYGLLMIDAAYEPFRQMQSSSFLKIIESHDTIAKLVVSQEEKFAAQGYLKPIGASENSMNLFYVKDGERCLLEFGEGRAFNKQGNVSFTLEELKQIALSEPEKLSNNVVTRPMMQEMSLPVLAFVGGPGELAYWSTLKEGFHAIDLQMPIFMPRMNITIVSRRAQRVLAEVGLTVEDVLLGRSKEKLNEFIDSIQIHEANDMIENIERQVAHIYTEIEELLMKSSIHLSKVVDKNKKFHIEQFHYLKNKIKEQVELKEDVQIRRYDTLHLELLPNEGYQERVYSPYKFLNEVGTTFIDQLMALNFQYSTSHQVVYI